jgi:hypothetical protein
VICKVWRSAMALWLSVITSCVWKWSINTINSKPRRQSHLRLTILYNVWGYSITSDHQLYRVTPLKTPFGLLIGLFQSQSHVTRFTHNYSLRCVTFTHLTILHVRNYNHLLHSYTFTLADLSAINYFLKLSQTLHLHTSKLSPRTYSANSLLKTAT